MVRRTSRRLVVDTSVLRSAGDISATHPTSKNCRDFLLKILKICHCVVSYREISQEWLEHKSRFSSRWMRTMTAKKKILYANVKPNLSLRATIKGLSYSINNRNRMLKDIHLIEAALETDRVIVSRDEEVRRLFCGASDKVSDFKKIAWVNPDKHKEYPIKWLEEGASLNRSRLLHTRPD